MATTSEATNAPDSHIAPIRGLFFLIDYITPGWSANIMQNA